MSADFNKNEFSPKIQAPKHLNDVLVGRFCRLRYEPLNKNYYNQNQESQNLKQYGDLHIKKEIQDFNNAKERMKHKMIASDNSTDNSVIYAAINQFKKKQ